MASVPADFIPEHQSFQGVIRAWAQNFGKDFKPYPLHRLDKNTSGLLLFGKYPRDRAALEAIFSDPTTQKTYLALVKWVPKEKTGTIRKALHARTVDKKVPAVTHYRFLKAMDNVSLLEVRIETGRKHQIRQHLAMIGHPLLLDHDYGDRSFDQNYQRKHKGKGQFFLHSWKLHFVHPFTGKETEIIAPTELYASEVE